MAKVNEKKNYIVGICCSEADGVRLERVYGTESQVKKYLAAAVRNDKSNDPDSFDMGSTSANQINVDKTTGELNGYATFYDYHIDYTATPEKEPIELES